MNSKATCTIVCFVICLVTSQLAFAGKATIWGDRAAKFIYGTCTQHAQAQTTVAAEKVKDYCICVVRKSFESITQKQHQSGVKSFVAFQRNARTEIPPMHDKAMVNLYNNSENYCDNFMHPSATASNKRQAKSISSRAISSVYDFGAYIKQHCGPVSKSVQDHPCTIKASRYWLKNEGRALDDVPYPYITANTLATSYLLGSSF